MVAEDLIEMVTQDPEPGEEVVWYGTVMWGEHVGTRGSLPERALAPGVLRDQDHFPSVGTLFPGEAVFPPAPMAVSGSSRNHFWLG